MYQGRTKTLFIRYAIPQIFVHCLSRDGSFLKAKNFDFCNFSLSFPPSHSPARGPNFSALSGNFFDQRKPAQPPSRPPAFSLSGAILRSRHSHSIPSVFLPPAPVQGDTLGIFLGKIILEGEKPGGGAGEDAGVEKGNKKGRSNELLQPSREIGRAHV